MNVLGSSAYADLFVKGNPFRGMFPRSRRRRQQEETEADEDSMASRLQLDMGAFLRIIPEYLLTES